MGKKKKIDWLNHFLEFIVVVIGILLAFQLNTCSEKKKEEAIVDSHISKIVEETNFNMGRIKGIQKNSESMLTMLDTLFNVIKDKDRLEREHFLTFKLMSLDYLYIKKNAYNTLVATGDIRYIENLDLQNDVVSLYEYYSWAEGYDTMTRNIFTDYYYPYMMDNMDMIGGNVQPLETYNSKEFTNILSSYKYSLVGRLNRQQELEKRVAEFLEKYDTSE